MKKKSKVKEKVSFKPISIEHTRLAKTFSKLMGYQCVINNNDRVAIIIDPSGQKGLLQDKEGTLYYFHKGYYEPIIDKEVETAKAMRNILPKPILKKLFGITHLNMRASNYQKI